VSFAERSVFAAYVVVFAVVLVYLVIIALKVSRLESDLAELVQRARDRDAEPAPTEQREEANVG
jgi:hypothetical protein